MTDDTYSVPSAVPLQRVATEPSFWRAMRGALFAPRALFADTRELTALGAPVRFAAGMEFLRGLVVSAVAAALTMMLLGSELFPATGLNDGAFSLLAKDFSVYLIGYPLAAVVAVFARGAVVQVVAVLSGGRGSYARSVRIAAYASAPMVLAGVFFAMQQLGVFPFPPLAAAAWVPTIVALGWGAWVVAEGVTILHGATRARAYPIALASLAGVWVLNARAFPPLVHAVQTALRLS